jgi:hypothetical protein
MAFEPVLHSAFSLTVRAFSIGRELELMVSQIRPVGLVLPGFPASAAPALSQPAEHDVPQTANGIYAVIAKPGIADAIRSTYAQVTRKMLV